MLELNGAAFYYDYTDKQLLGYLVVPPFGSLPSLVSIPKSKVEGAELSATLHLTPALTLSASGTYIETRVGENPPNPTGPYGNTANFVGQSFPYTPRWQGVLDSQYRVPISSSLYSFFGANMTARSATNGALLSGVTAVAAEESLLRIPSFTLLDLRAGIESDQGRWRVEIWGRNVTNRFYVAGATRNSDFTTRFTGMPATFGISLRYRFGQ
jgi:outer membrane receptor protein involved in Fe transport